MAPPSCTSLQPSAQHAGKLACPRLQNNRSLPKGCHYMSTRLGRHKSSVARCIWPARRASTSAVPFEMLSEAGET